MKKETVFNKTVLLLMALLLSLSPTLHSQEEEDISYVFRGYYAARYAFSFSSDFFAGEHTAGFSYEFYPKLSVGFVAGVVAFNSPRTTPVLTIPKHLPGEVALAWLLANPIVTAPIIGPRTIEQLESAAQAASIELDEDTLKKLDEIFPGPGGEAPMAYAW